MKTSAKDLPGQLGRADIWLGQETCREPGYSTGIAALDAALPDGGWPRHGVCELSCPVAGSQSLLLLTPLLRTLTRERDCPVLLVGAPWQLNPVYLLQHGLRPEHFCQVSPASRKDTLWAMEQSLGSGGCRLLLGWLDRLTLTEARRLQLAAEKGACLAIILVDEPTAGNPLPLRLGISPAGGTPSLLSNRRSSLPTHPGQLELKLLKRRGGQAQESLLLDGLSPLLARYLPEQGSPRVVQGPWGVH
ncbi:hypothetical protein KJI95_15930 [Shewanella sp. JM162201]|uniref:SOS cell division inhibitor SulA n=1 Tax=Shewanella jiangmenensis TaxID=2837387 RepID=A0ABS5V7Q8_9GAMM|nr:hypothetical protein [Shewanella jiangmenensis]MBT1445985.1 hypothetical protein [Shewanella jiangmenensis]